MSVLVLDQKDFETLHKGIAGTRILYEEILSEYFDVENDDYDVVGYFLQRLSIGNRSAYFYSYWTKIEEGVHYDIYQFKRLKDGPKEVVNIFKKDKKQELITLELVSKSLRYNLECQKGHKRANEKDYRVLDRIIAKLEIAKSLFDIY